MLLCSAVSTRARKRAWEDHLPKVWLEGLCWRAHPELELICLCCFQVSEVKAVIWQKVLWAGQAMPHSRPEQAQLAQACAGTRGTQ